MREETYPFVTKPLPYEYDALVPVLDADTLLFHHDRHYRAYVEQLNSALSDYPELQRMSLKELLAGLSGLPAPVQERVRNHGGGVYNHELYFDSLGPLTGQEPAGALAEAIKRDFGSYQQWKEKMGQAALSKFGSGWVYLVADGSGRLSVLQTSNQDVPELEIYTPILSLDVWEHAYYLQYRNRRGDYVDGWFKLIHWKKANRRYEELSERAG